VLDALVEEDPNEEEAMDVGALDTMDAADAPRARGRGRGGGHGRPHGVAGGPCGAGQYFDSNVCLECPEGTHSHAVECLPLLGKVLSELQAPSVSMVGDSFGVVHISVIVQALPQVYEGSLEYSVDIAPRADMLWHNPSGCNTMLARLPSVLKLQGEGVFKKPRFRPRVPDSFLNVSVQGGGGGVFWALNGFFRAPFRAKRFLMGKHMMSYNSQLHRGTTFGPPGQPRDPESFLNRRFLKHPPSPL